MYKIALSRKKGKFGQKLSIFVSFYVKKIKIWLIKAKIWLIKLKKLVNKSQNLSLFCCFLKLFLCKKNHSKKKSKFG